MAMLLALLAGEHLLGGVPTRCAGSAPCISSAVPRRSGETCGLAGPLTAHNRLRNVGVGRSVGRSVGQSGGADGVEGCRER